MNLYQELIDADVAEAEIEQRIGEGETLTEIYLQKVDDGVIDPETGYCMCGTAVDDHDIGSGHGPVDEGWYAVDLLRGKLKKEIEL